MRPHHAVATVTIALFALAPSANAQDSTTAPRGQYLVGLGTNANGDRLLPSLQLGREWRTPGSRLGLRLTGDFNASSTTTPSYPYYFVNGASGTNHTTTRDLTFGAAATYALLQGRIQPYLISGFTIGYQNYRFNYEADPAYATMPSGRPNESFAVREDQLTLGLQAGLGLSARIGRRTVFAEVRSLNVGRAGPFGPPTPQPLTFGLRF